MKSNPKILWNHALLSVTLVLVTATGCQKKTAPPPPPAETAPTVTAPAPTATLSADPLAIEVGQSVVLNWRTTNATSVSIDGIGAVAINGTQTVSPSSSTNFHLVAKGDGGTVDASVRVTVRIPVAPSEPDTSGAMGGDAAFHAAVSDLFFDYDSYTLRSDAEPAITAAAAYLTAHPEIKVLVAGYCDDRGSAEYNITLGENRAAAAKSALVAAGIDASRIRVVSYGKERQFCTDETDACWQQNRRDQFSIDR